VTDAVATMLENARAAGEIKGLVTNLIEGGVTHLQYADDTIIFLALEEDSIIYTKFLLYYFENMSGLRINYKSEVMVIGGSNEDQVRVDEAFNCKLASLPMKYLGVMVSNKHITISDLAHVYQIK
jgi:hypothetical protein